jgi:hypothetical protein
MKRQIVVHATWDREAQVWVATSDDVQGLAIEAATVELLEKKVVPAIQELIELNGIDSNLREIPVEIRSAVPEKVLNPSS